MIQIVPRNSVSPGPSQFAKLFLILATGIAAAASGSSVPAVAQQETVLHNFVAFSSDGYEPYAGLVFDDVGSLYGTTRNGGSNASGTVFELLPQVGGGYKEKILHNFH